MFSEFHSLPRFPVPAILAFSGLLVCSAFAENPLQPIMCVADKVVIQDDFSKPGPINKAQWEARQGTQWKVEDGVLRGRPSTAEHQASVPSHKGLEPRIAAPGTPKEFIARFSIRFLDGTETDVSPFVEFGHHVCRLRLSSNGAELLAGPDMVRVAEAKDFHFEPGQWYHLLAEMQGSDFVIQIADGPTIYARQQIFTQPPPAGAAGLGVAGTRGGTAEIDDVTIWTVKPGTVPGWDARREAFPKFGPTLLPPNGKKAAE
jgi:hypothetical protein